MRTTFTNFCCEKAQLDDTFQLLTADLGFGIFDQFRENFPASFVNVGVAEQNLIGIATGMALSGMRPVCYSLGNFPTMRCLEQIRNDAAYHNAEIMIVSSGGGFGYGQLGMSHHATEDVGIMRPLPNVEIYVPGTPTEAKLLFPAIFERKNVKYVRLEKTGPDYEYINKTPLSDGFFMYRAGKDGVIFSMGTLLSEALRAAEKLALQGLEFSVCSLAVVKSSDTETRTGLRELISNVKTVATIEEHNIIGGIGSYLCEIISTSCLNIKVHRIGMKDCYSSVVGDQEFLRQYYGINEETLVSLILADHD